MENRKYWSGKKIIGLTSTEVFVYGSNVKGVNGAGGAKAAMLLDKTAQHGIGRGFNGSNTYALLTKILDNQANYFEKSTGITYNKTGYCSVSPAQIRANIDELYTCALQHPDKSFLISYQFETWPNGSPKKSLNGYDSKEFLEMFIREDIPQNIVFHDSYKPFIEANLTKSVTNKETIIQNNSETLSEIAFTKVALPYGWLGNMAPYPVTYNSTLYPTTEALFQALRFENHPEVQKEIIEQKSPMSAKMVAKKYKHLLEADNYELMGQKDVDNMKLCVKLKLEQYPELAQELVNTGTSKIIEDCSSRPQGSGLFWGAAKTENGWTGKNILGEIFMEYRQELQNNNSLSGEPKKEPTYTFFFQATSPFSQWHPALFIYKELQFICTEQFMMYAKAKTFKDDFVADKIINIEKCFDTRDEKGNFKNKEDADCYNLILDFKEGKIDRTQIVSHYPTLNTWKKVQAVIKKLGREVKNYNEEVWVSKRVPVVSVGNREKYNQNLDLKEILMATGDSIMVEASVYDKIWGIGLDEATAKKTHPSKWPGLNLLGLDVLTNLKTYYRNEPGPTTKMKM